MSLLLINTTCSMANFLRFLHIFPETVCKLNVRSLINLHFKFCVQEDYTMKIQNNVFWGKP